MLPPADEGGDLDPELRRDARGAVHYVASRFAWEQSARGHSFTTQQELKTENEKASKTKFFNKPLDVL
jgi:hypothetical protein